MTRMLRLGLLSMLLVTAPGAGLFLTSPRAAETLHRSLDWVTASPEKSILTRSGSDASLTDPDSIASAASSEASGPESIAEAPATYSIAQVMRWAYDRSPEAALIEAESAAVMRGVDPHDPDSCCSARLVRNVLAEVALARRADDATHAAVAYHKLVAAEDALSIINQAIAVEDRLIEMSEQAERLELPDGDPLKLNQSRLQLLAT